jgi:hypothetical protein
VIKSLEVSKSCLNSIQNVKNDLTNYKSLIRIEKIVNHLNPEISKRATCIINLIDLDGQNDGMTDY